jgi:hypothetical protein
MTVTKPAVFDYQRDFSPVVCVRYDALSLFL